MATPADQRLLELLEKWLNSLELHLKYSALDADSYSKIQPWPEHERPSRWIIDLAKQKALALQNQVRERVGQGDARFAESLELMMFLANLVAADHIERFIPLASVENEQSLHPAPAAAAGPLDDAATGTREMPKFLAGPARPPAPVMTPKVARTERKAPAGDTPAKAAKPGLAPRRPAAKKTPEPADAATDAVAAPLDPVHAQVIADAARLMQWGRKWYELAELVSGMADRPARIDVRRILQDNKAIIEKKAGR